MIPVFMKIHVAERGKKKARLFIPLILVWIVLASLLIVLAPLVLAASLILWPSGYGKILLAVWPRFFSLICSLSGLCVLVENKKEKIFISVT